MIDPNFVLLYVADPAASARFYEQLLDKRPVEESPTFAMFALSSGVMLGLWGRSGVEPAAAASPAPASWPSRLPAAPMSIRPTPTGAHVALPCCKRRPSSISATPSSARTRMAIACARLRRAERSGPPASAGISAQS